MTATEESARVFRLQRSVHRKNLLAALAVLRTEMIDNPENRDQVLIDLIRLVKEMV